MAAAASPHPDWDLPPFPAPGQRPEAPELAGDKAESLRELAAWFREEGLPETPDADLVKFLHSCDYDLAKAKTCAKDFHYGRREVPEMFTDGDVSLPNLQSIFKILELCILPRKTPENHRILMTRLTTSDTSSYYIPDVNKVTLMAVESILLTEPTVDGVIINDLEKSTFTHVVNIHLLHCSGFITKALKMVKSFFRAEDMEKLRLHAGDDLSEPHKAIPRDCLPSDVGGTLPSIEELHKMTVNRLAAIKEVFERESLKT